MQDPSNKENAEIWSFVISMSKLLAEFSQDQLALEFTENICEFCCAKIKVAATPGFLVSIFLSYISFFIQKSIAVRTKNDDDRFEAIRSVVPLLSHFDYFVRKSARSNIADIFPCLSDKSSASLFQIIQASDIPAASLCPLLIEIVALDVSISLQAFKVFLIRLDENAETRKFQVLLLKCSLEQRLSKSGGGPLKELFDLLCLKVPDVPTVVGVPEFVNYAQGWKDISSGNIKPDSSPKIRVQSLILLHFLILQAFTLYSDHKTASLGNLSGLNLLHLCFWISWYAECDVKHFHGPVARIAATQKIINILQTKSTLPPQAFSKLMLIYIWERYEVSVLNVTRSVLVHLFEMMLRMYQEAIDEDVFVVTARFMHSLFASSVSSTEKVDFVGQLLEMFGRVNQEQICWRFGFLISFLHHIKSISASEMSKIRAAFESSNSWKNYSPILGENTTETLLSRFKVFVDSANLSECLLESDIFGILQLACKLPPAAPAQTKTRSYLLEYLQTFDCHSENASLTAKYFGVVEEKQSSVKIEFLRKPFESVVEALNSGLNLCKFRENATVCLSVQISLALGTAGSSNDASTAFHSAIEIERFVGSLFLQIKSGNQMKDIPSLTVEVVSRYPSILQKYLPDLVLVSLREKSDRPAEILEKLNSGLRSVDLSVRRFAVYSFVLLLSWLSSDSSLRYKSTLLSLIDFSNLLQVSLSIYSSGEIPLYILESYLSCQAIRDLSKRDLPISLLEMSQDIYKRLNYHDSTKFVYNLCREREALVDMSLDSLFQSCEVEMRWSEAAFIADVSEDNSLKEKRLEALANSGLTNVASMCRVKGMLFYLFPSLSL